MCTCAKKITIHEILKTDPTRTITLRRKFENELVKRFKIVRKYIYDSIYTNDCFGLKEERPTVPGVTIQEAIPYKQFAFERDGKKVSEFLQWLQRQIDSEILEVSESVQLGEAIEKAWTNKYIQTAYQKGILRGRQELINAGFSVPGMEDPFAGIVPAFNQPFHLDRVGAIYTRTYTDLKGITDDMSKQISSTLAQGMAEGRNPLELAKQIASRVGKMKGFERGPMDAITRARILARTEVIRAHHVATIQEYKNWGVEGVQVLAEWSTAGDNRVCSLCKPLQGRTFTLDEILPMIPRHPQCRCIALPKDVTDE